MLTELVITNFAIIDELRLNLAPGFNALTGETGAGKSIIIDAVALLLGGRADASMVRAGADLAQIEGTFLLDEPLQSLINPILEREGIEGETPDTLILGREIRTNPLATTPLPPNSTGTSRQQGTSAGDYRGRSYCRINGRAVSLAVLGEISQPLVDIHGQGEHLSLLRVATHQRLLDRFGGLEAQREALAEQVRHLRATRRELDALLHDEKELARRVDQLTYQVEEIDAARLKLGEESELTAERTRLANAERLAQLATAVCQALYEGSPPAKTRLDFVGDYREEQTSAADLLDQASRALNQLVQIDPELTANQQLAESLGIQVSELAHTVRTYRDNIEINPQRLSYVEERLALIHGLKRKYGQTIEEILAFGEQGRSELERITHSEERIEQLRAEEERLRRQIGSAALALSQARRLAAERLAAGTEAQLADLNMKGARFAVDITWADDPNGVYVEGRSLACGENGIDRVEFLVAPNPGEGLNPLAKTASGGETSRLMLALKTVLAAADETPTLIFDELDQGIGGRVGAVVGRKLRGISHAASGSPLRSPDGFSQGGRQRQVLCVTHLPQIAGHAEVHFMVEKRVSGQRTTTHIRRLEGADRVEELAAMLGTPSEGTRRSAQEILAEAARA